MSTACNTEHSINFAIPYRLFPNDSSEPNPWTDASNDDPIQFWIHFGLVVSGFLTAVLTFVVQLFIKIPYGKLNDEDENKRCEVNLRITFGISQILAGIVIFTVTYFSQTNFAGIPNLVMYILFTIHYINRGIVDTIVNRHRLRKIPVYIPLLATLILVVYHFINGQFLGAAQYCNGYYYDPRFIVGLVMFVAGFVINRVADAQLVCLRDDYRDSE